ncbi:hypothetical protein LTR16_009065, partial [Cryomyces antarcticus]
NKIRADGRRCHGRQSSRRRRRQGHPHLHPIPQHPHPRVRAARLHRAHLRPVLFSLGPLPRRRHLDWQTRRLQLVLLRRLLPRDQQVEFAHCAHHVDRVEQRRQVRRQRQSGHERVCVEFEGAWAPRQGGERAQGWRERRCVDWGRGGREGQG